MTGLASIWAVVTSYRPDDLAEGVGRLIRQTVGVIVVDDGSGPRAREELNRARDLGAQVIELAENTGIGRALNVGIARAMECGADAVVTFDQDSTVPSGFVDALAGRHDERERAGRPAAPVVPQYFADVDQASRSDGNADLIARNAIQSGMLLPREVLESIGPFREDFFIDLVDTEFVFRCRRAGVEVSAVAGLRLEHSLGVRLRSRSVLARGLGEVTLSAPFRYYYRVRNRIVLEREYARDFPGQLLRDGILDRAHFAIALVLSRPRRALWTVMSEGRRDARRNTLGRAPEGILRQARRVSWDADPVQRTSSAR